MDIISDTSMLPTMATYLNDESLPRVKICKIKTVATHRYFIVRSHAVK